VAVTLFWVLFFVLNRTTVISRRNVGEERNTLLLSNHQSMLDSFLVCLAAFYPQSWLRPHLIPWNPAAAENFYKSPVLAWLPDNRKWIWVREGRRDVHALHRMTRLLPRGVMTVFPEGTRSGMPPWGRGDGSGAPRARGQCGFLALPRTRETAQAVIERVMAAIRAQHAELWLWRTGGGNRTS
jgi:1-acyl-sn-glycerol-3-phosphate acyltransferase